YRGSPAQAAGIRQQEHRRFRQEAQGRAGTRQAGRVSLDKSAGSQKAGRKARLFICPPEISRPEISMLDAGLGRVAAIARGVEELAKLRMTDRLAGRIVKQVLLR